MGAVGLSGCFASSCRSVFWTISLRMKASIIGQNEKKTAIHGENVVVATFRKFASARKIHKSQNRREMHATAMVMKKRGMKMNKNETAAASLVSRLPAGMQLAMVIIASKTTAKIFSERSSLFPFGALSCIIHPFCTIYKRCMTDFWRCARFYLCKSFIFLYILCHRGFYVTKECF